MKTLPVSFTIYLYFVLLCCYSQTSPYKIKSNVIIQEVEADKFLSTLGTIPSEEIIDGDSAVYFNFYEDNDYIRDSREKYFAGLAMFFKERAEKMEVERDDRINELIKEHLNDSMPSEDIAIFEQKRENVYNEYQIDISRFRNKAVEYYFHYLNLSGLQGPILKNPDKALRTSLFYENNVVNKKDKFLNSFGVTFGKDNNVSVFSELYKDYMGVFRISLGTLISNTGRIESDSSGITVIDESERKDATIQRIIGGGGNFIGLISYPIFHARSKDEAIRILSTLNSKPSIDVPMLGTVSNDFNFNWYNFHDLSMILSGLEGNLAFLLSNKFGHFVGNKSYYRYLNLDPDSNIRRQGMFMHQFQIGIKFGDTFLITYSSYYGHPFVQSSMPNSLSLSLVPR